MVPFEKALAELGLSQDIAICPVQSGYPAPKVINQVLFRRRSSWFQFEASAARPDVIADTHAHLAARGVDRLEGVLVTHCHGDHAGSAGIIAGYGRPAGERAPIYVHSASYRFLTHPEPAFLNETYELFLTRAHWGLIQFNTLSSDDMVTNAIRSQYAGYFARVPKSALRFVDQAQLPDGIWALYTPGHSNDCVLYYDEERGVAIPGDTIICTGIPEKPETHAYVIPIFTVAGQSYSMAFERYVHTIGVLRRFFETHRVRAVLPPHGRFAITRPLEWVRFAEGYFKGIYRALLEDFLSDPEWKGKPFMACDLSRYIPSAGAHPISTPSHTFGMLCALVDEGYFSMTEDTNTRQISFMVEHTPPDDWLTRSFGKDPGPLPLFKHSQRASAVNQPIPSNV
ncbi:MAG TPA: MBL fold metallo-hydrolase [Polyangiaceae bacterium]|jgi:glyoxylase-like metal-dependent hydrolase (beta-lactamase superfamily II)|nr:MBL fold metallo-hydrolase [Polyangiaceae bacterium]